MSEVIVRPFTRRSSVGVERGEGEGPSGPAVGFDDSEGRFRFREGALLPDGFRGGVRIKAGRVALS
jgi:hypothetical protein